MGYGRFDETRDEEGNRDFIKVSKPRPGTTLITMDRPDRMNSMAFEQAIPLHAALEEVAQGLAEASELVKREYSKAASGAEVATAALQQLGDQV